MTTDIIDRIDELVDDQLAGGEPLTGYDYDDPTYPECWHCGRHWHGLPITVRIAAMYERAWYDEDYRADQDDSAVICPGSDFIGPMPANPDGDWFYAPCTALMIGEIAARRRRERARNIHLSVRVDHEALRRWRQAMERFNQEMAAALFGSGMADAFREFGQTMQRVTHSFREIIEVSGYRIPVIETRLVPAVLTAPLDLKVEFGPQHWITPAENRFASWAFMRAVRDNWAAITTPETHAPPAPGYDFTRYDNLVDEHPGWTTHTNRSRRP